MTAAHAWNWNIEPQKHGCKVEKVRGESWAITQRKSCCRFSTCLPAKTRNVSVSSIIYQHTIKDKYFSPPLPYLFLSLSLLLCVWVFMCACVRWWASDQRLALKSIYKIDDIFFLFSLILSASFLSADLFKLSIPPPFLVRFSQQAGGFYFTPLSS